MKSFSFKLKHLHNLSLISMFWGGSKNVFEMWCIAGALCCPWDEGWEWQFNVRFNYKREQKERTDIVESFPLCSLSGVWTTKCRMTKTSICFCSEHQSAKPSQWSLLRELGDTQRSFQCNWSWFAGLDLFCRNDLPPENIQFVSSRETAKQSCLVRCVVRWP